MLFNENCFETFKNMNDKSVDYVFTSPPYNRERNDKYLYFNDRQIDYQEMISKLITESLRVSKKYVFLNIMKNYYNSDVVYNIFGGWSKIIAEVFIWEKSNPLPAAGNAITNSFEYIIAFGEKGLKSNTTYTKNHLTTSVAIMPDEHKAVMHEDVARFFIENFTQQNELVYDPFMGTGTTAIVCEKLGRKWIGSEIAKEYFDMANKRINKLVNEDLFYSVMKEPDSFI